jgi:transposase
MAEPLIPDELWSELKPLLPAHPPDPRGGGGGGAPRKPDRACLEGIAHVPKTGCQWQELPASDRWPSGSTCWRRFDEWSRAGAWARLHRALLDRLGARGEVDLARVVVDSASCRAKTGARTPAPTPRTAGNAGVSGTWSRTRTACRSWSPRRRPTSATRSR